MGRIKNINSRRNLKSKKNKTNRRNTKHRVNSRSMKKRSVKKRIMKSKKKYKGGLTEEQEIESNNRFLKYMWVNKEYWDQVIKTGYYEFAVPNEDITYEDIFDANRNKWTPPKKDWVDLDYSLRPLDGWPLPHGTVDYRSGPHINPKGYNNYANGTLYRIGETKRAYKRFVYNSPCSNKNRCKCSIKDCNNYYFVPNVSEEIIENLGPRWHDYYGRQPVRGRTINDANNAIIKLYKDQGWWQRNSIVWKDGNLTGSNGYVGWFPDEDHDGGGMTYYLCPICYEKRLREEEDISRKAVLHEREEGRKGPHKWPDSSIELTPSAPPAHELEPVVIAQEIPHLSFKIGDSVHFKHSDGRWYDGTFISSNDKGVYINLEGNETPIFIPNERVNCSIIKNCD